MTKVNQLDEERSTMNAADALLSPALSSGLGGKAAIEFESVSITYAELDAIACQAANALTDLGLKTGDRVLILMDDRPEYFFVYLGAMKAGIVPVGLNVRLSAKNLAHIIADSAAKLVVAEAQFVHLFEDAVAGNPAPPILMRHDEAGDDTLRGIIARYPATFPSVPLAPQDMALWMYTSGTTGNPKAVVHAQRTISKTDRYFCDVFKIDAQDRIFATSKLFFAFSLGHILLCTLRRGATAILHAGWPDAEAVVRTVEAKKPTVFLSVPTMFRNLLEAETVDRFQSVRLFISAGERLPVQLFERWREASGRHLCEGIGATENLMLFIVSDPEDCRPGAAGKPAPGVTARLVADDGGDVEDAGAAGELWIKSPTLALGYWHQEAKSAAVFQDGWYRTGDMFSRDADGFYTHEGRADDMLKISGQWVSPAEIEDRVLAHQEVAQAAVLGIKNADGLVRLALCMVLSNPAIDRPALEARLTESLVSQLSIYKCPRRFIYLDDMPLTPTGKLQRFRLRDMVAEMQDSQAAG